MSAIGEPETPATGDVPAFRCLHCFDGGIVCEDHPEFPAYVTVEGHSGDCSPAGMPCPACCSPVPADGTHPAWEAFVPDWRRSTR